MKKLIVAACILLFILPNIYAQTKKQHSPNDKSKTAYKDDFEGFVSTLQIDGSSNSITKEEFVIGLQSRVDKTTQISISDQHHDPNEFIVEYFKTVEEADGTVRYYRVVSGTSKFKTFKILAYKQKRIYLGDSFSTMLAFSNSDFFGNKTNDFAFLCQ